MDVWEQAIIALVGGGTVGALATSWAQWVIEKQRSRVERRRELVDNGWTTVSAIRANEWDVAPASPRVAGARNTPRERVVAVHDLFKKHPVLRLLGDLTDEERQLVEENHLVDRERRDGLVAFEAALRRLSKKWKLS